MRHWDEDGKRWIGLDANKIRAPTPETPETTPEIMIAALIARLETERAAGRLEGIREAIAALPKKRDESGHYDEWSATWNGCLNAVRAALTAKLEERT